MSQSNAVDVVLVNPGARTRIYQSLGTRLTAVENPVWAGLIATFVRKQGFSVEIVDAEADEFTPMQIAERVESIDPRLVVDRRVWPSAVRFDAEHDRRVSHRAPRSSSEIADRQDADARRPRRRAAGAHAGRGESCDFVAHDEGLYDDRRSARGAVAPATTDSGKVRGLVLSRTLRQFRSQCRRRRSSSDLDADMPGIAWDLLPMQRYRAHNWHCFGHLNRQPYAAIYTTLGCPYHCSFCCIQAPFKSGEKAAGLKDDVNSYRFWSPARVIEEIDLLVNKYGVRNIKFADEMFVLNPRHVLGICDLIIERGYDLNIWAYARVDTVKDGMLDKLKRAGFNWLALGIEAADDRVADRRRQELRVSEVYDTVGEIKAAGINIIGNYIFGLPEDTLDTHAADARSGAGPELRVREFLLGDGLSGLAAL